MKNLKKMRYTELKEYAQQLLREAGLGVNDAPNGISLPICSLDPATIPQAAKLHLEIHTKREALEFINELQKVQGDTDGTIAVLRAKELKYVEGC